MMYGSNNGQTELSFETRTIQLSEEEKGEFEEWIEYRLGEKEGFNNWKEREVSE